MPFLALYCRLWSYVIPYRIRLAGSLFCGVLVAATTTLAVLFVQPVMDGIFIAKDHTRLVFFPVGIIALYGIRGVLSFGHLYLLRATSQQMIRDVRNQLFMHLQSLPLGFLQQHHSGTLMTRVTHDTVIMEQAISSLIQHGLGQTLTMLGLLGAAFYRDWLLATLAVAVLPLAGLVLGRLGRLIRRVTRQAFEHLGGLNTLLEEVLGGILVVKGFGREAYEKARFRQRNEIYYQLLRRAIRFEEIGSPLMECLAACGVAAVVWYGGARVIAGHTTPGTFFSFLTALLMLYEPLRRLSRLNSTLQGALAASERIFELLDTADERQEETATASLTPLRQSLRFHNVALRYQHDAPEVLQDITFDVQVGEVVALVGMSGAGKTSLVNLLPRFYEPTAGYITMDEVDIRTVSLASLRQQIGMVTQETVLFDDTIRHNIRYGNLQATDAQIDAAARAAYAYDFIQHLPEGYDTVIGERGVRLSGGEKQRLAIARALLRDAPLLILDEATSSLDSTSEAMVQAALAHLMRHRTTLVIAHRLATVRHADKIVVLHQGRIVDIGRHEELLARAGLYRRLYELQFKSQEWEEAGTLRISMRPQL